LTRSVDMTGSGTTSDTYRHGTHIAGIIAAESNNKAGIAGIAPESRIMNVKVADDAGRSKSSVVAGGIIWATDNGASIINISIEFHEPSGELEQAINYAWNNGVLVVAAAGNGGSHDPTYPAYYENVVAVAATRQDDTLASMSNYGDWVDVAAPGFDIYSTVANDRFAYKSGPSFATAYVSGLAALLFSMAVDKDGDGRLNGEVRSAIELGAQASGISGAGAGRINAARSLEILLNN
jgi:thermitase